MPNSLSDHSWCASGLGKGLRAYCASRGIDMAPFAREAGLEPDVFDEGKERVSIERFGAMLNQLAKASGEESFGISAGSSYRLGDTGPMGFALMNAPNLGAMWRFYGEVADLAIDQTSYSFEEGDGLIVNVHSYSPLMRHHETFQDYSTTIFIKHIRVHAGNDWMPRQIEFERPAPRDPAPWHRMFGKTVIFDRHIGKTHVFAADMELSNPNADPRLHALFREGLIAARDAMHEQRDIVQRLRSIVQRNLHLGRVDLASIAKDMALSERSLQRRLSERGLRFDQVVQSVQRDLVQVLLARPDMRLEQVAERCGYSSAASFSRAVSSWYGVPPSTLRERLRTMTAR